MNTTSDSQIVKLQKIVSGLRTRLPGLTSLMLGGESVTEPEFVKGVQTELDAIKAAADARAAYRAAVDAQRAAHAANKRRLRFFKSFVLLQLGDSVAASEALADFGYTPRKVSTKSPAQKTLASEKALATRAARGTRGPKQKAKIKGTVTPAASPVPLPTGNGGKPL